METMTYAARRKDVSSADRKHATEQYGNVKFADEANKKYPIDTEGHIRAAWNYINKGKNAAKYGASEVRSIKSKIVAAWKDKIDKKGPPSASQTKESAMQQVRDFQVFAAGQYEDKKEGTIDFTEKELDDIVEEFNSEGYQGPIVLGHYTDYKNNRIPAFGWINGLKRIGTEIWTNGAEFADELVDAIKQGYYGNRSIGLAKKNGAWVFTHLGILGSAPPEVRGMKPSLKAAIGMAAKEENVYEFDTEFAALDIEEIESLAQTDTMMEIEERFASCAQLIDSVLNEKEDDEDDEEDLQECMNALYSCYASVGEVLRKHYSFLEKTDSIAERFQAKGNEMAAKFKEIIHKLKRKESPVDAVAEKKYQDEIAEHKAKIIEFQKKELLASDAKADEALKSQIAEFVASPENKAIQSILKDMKFEEMAFSLAKANAQLEFSSGEKKSTLDVLKGLVARIPRPELKETEFAKDVDKVKQFGRGSKAGLPVNMDHIALVEKAHKYLADHQAQYKECTQAEAISRILIDAGMKKITL